MQTTSLLIHDQINKKQNTYLVCEAVWRMEKKTCHRRDVIELYLVEPRCKVALSTVSSSYSPRFLSPFLYIMRRYRKIMKAEASSKADVSI